MLGIGRTEGVLYEKVFLVRHKNSNGPMFLSSSHVLHLASSLLSRPNPSPCHIEVRSQNEEGGRALQIRAGSIL